MAVVKAWAKEAKECQVVEELEAVGAARCKAVLAMMETATEEAETEQAVILLASRRGVRRVSWHVTTAQCRGLTPR